VETELGEKVLVLITHFVVKKLLERAQRAGCWWYRALK